MRSIFFIREVSQNMGGIETQVYRLAYNFYKRKIFEPVLITSNSEAPLSKLFIESGFSVYTVNFNNIIKGVYQTNNIIKKYDVAIIQSHMFRESIIGRLVHLLNPKIPHVFRVHTYIDCSWISSYKKNLYHILEKTTSFLVNGYICINEYASNELIHRSKIERSKIFLVSNAIDKLGECEENEFSSNNIYKIAMVSNLTPHKGHDVLIKGISILKTRGIKVKVRLIGGEKTADSMNLDNSFTKFIIEQSEKYGVGDQIEFYGYTKNVYEALRGYPIVVLPSDSEGTPNSLLEAMSVKKLVIASNVGGIPEFIENGISGYLHSPQSPEDFARVVECVLGGPLEKLKLIANNGYIVWKENYKTEIIIDKLLDCYFKMGIIKGECFENEIPEVEKYN